MKKSVFSHRPLWVALTALSALSGAAQAEMFHFRQPANGLVARGVTPATPSPTSCVAPWGGSVATNATVTAYQTASVPYGSTCATEIRTCESSGTLSGSYTQAACTVDAQRTVVDFGAYRGWSDGSYATSCNAYRTATGSATYAGATGSGMYRLSVGGSPLDAYCDMTSAGGGWTRVVRQYEATPVRGWTGGTNGNAYVLAANQIPAHTQVAFGRDNTATTTDYVSWTYTTGDIAPVSVTGVVSGKAYKVYRSSIAFYGNHNPTSGAYTLTCPAGNGNWCNSLSLAPLSGEAAWAFSPLNDFSTAYRGYAMDGIATFMGADAYAWTVWVR